MGSLSPEDDDGNKSISVFVTGFGAFGENKINPSYLIASNLPSTCRVPNHPPVKIHTHPTPITVAYKTIRESVPKLIFSDSVDAVSSSHPHSQSKLPHSHPNYDIVLHIGMAPGRDFYTLETLAHRDGYGREDVYGETLEGDTFWKDEYHAPKTLHTEFDTKDVLKRWKSGLENEDIRSSNDPGYYLCDFIYYTSLVEYWRRDPNGPRPVMFLHVPGGSENEDVERGRKVALGLISALVESRNWL